MTDANLYLGYLPSELLGGAFKLDVAAAATAIETIAEQIGMDAQHAAEGIIDLVNETMNGALRLVSVEQGFDPGDFALCAFGGAGPLHANALGYVYTSIACLRRFYERGQTRLLLSLLDLLMYWHFFSEVRNQVWPSVST